MPFHRCDGHSDVPQLKPHSAEHSTDLLQILCELSILLLSWLVLLFSLFPLPSQHALQRWKLWRLPSWCLSNRDSFHTLRFTSLCTFQLKSVVKFSSTSPSCGRVHFLDPRLFHGNPFKIDRFPLSLRIWPDFLISLTFQDLIYPGVSSVDWCVVCAKTSATLFEVNFESHTNKLS